ncbi:peptide MFS transporter [Sphingopyxis granuli]|uniref:peptide MFS transporter n=1 Tax=Sphingopyxis granuli TaxID=267128 RepID=UPI00083474CC|nr:peptide MFS transporter [Sphingopyxis granuli]
MSAEQAPPVRPRFLGHPRGLVVLFFVEMWERFSYYGMRALLILYLTQHFLFSDSKAQGLYAAYASLVYLMPLVGGIVADRYLGSRKAVLIGALFLTAGHFTMVFEGQGGREYLEGSGQRWEIVAEGRGSDRTLTAADATGRHALEFSADGARIADGAGTMLASGSYRIVTVGDPVGEAAFFLALSLIIVGVGFLKPNISALLGTLYEPEDPARDSGFTIFYVGINLGSLLAAGICGWLGVVYGWRYGFGLAGIGMLIGLAILVRWTPLLEGRGGPPDGYAPAWQAWVWIGAMLALGPVWWLVQRDEITSALLMVVSTTAFAAMLIWSIFHYRGVVRTRMVVAIVLMLFAVVFRMLSDQAGSSMTLYAARISDLRIIGDLRMTAAQTALFNPLLIVLLAPLFAMLWMWLDRRALNPSVPVKFSIGLCLTGLGFLTLAFGASNFAQESVVDGKTTLLVPLVWLFLCYLLHTLGEICLSPVGLSMVTKLSPQRMAGLMMGLWFLASSLAYAIAGQIAKLTASDTAAGVVVDARAQLDIYVLVFSRIGWIGVAAALLLLVLTPLLKRGLAGIR